MDGPGASGMPGGGFGGGLLKMFQVGLDEVVHEGKPEARFSLFDSGADRGSV